MKNLFTDLGRFFQHRVDEVGSHILQSGQVGQLVAAVQLVEDEAHVAQGCLIVRHDS